MISVTRKKKKMTTYLVSLSSTDGQLENTGSIRVSSHAILAVASLNPCSRLDRDAYCRKAPLLKQLLARLYLLAGRSFNLTWRSRAAQVIAVYAVDVVPLCYRYTESLSGILFGFS